MSTAVSSTIAASFPTHDQAEAAIEELWHSGFAHEDIGIAGPSDTLRKAQTAGGALDESGGHGAAIGAATGGVAGALVGGLVAALLPGIGMVLTGGLLVEDILATATGAAAGGFLGPFVALGLSSDEAKHFSGELKAGRTIVVVKTELRAPDALEIFHRHAGHGLDQGEDAGLDGVGEAIPGSNQAG
jgi:hypothetical protein